MNWIIWGILASLFTAAWGLTLEGTSKNIKNIHEHLIYLLIIFVFSSIISVIGLLLYYIYQKKTFMKVIKKDINFLNITILVFLLIGSMITVKLAFQGGGIAQVIINFNVIFTIFGSYFLFQKKIDWQIILGIILTILTSSYAVYENVKINN